MATNDRVTALRCAPEHTVVGAWAFPGDDAGDNGRGDATAVDLVLHGSHFTPLVTRAQLACTESAINARLRCAVRTVPLLVGAEAQEYLVGPGYTTVAV